MRILVGQSCHADVYVDFVENFPVEWADALLAELDAGSAWPLRGDAVMETIMFVWIGSVVLALVVSLVVGMLIGKRLAIGNSNFDEPCKAEANSGPVLAVEPDDLHSIQPRTDITPDGLPILSIVEMPEGFSVLIDVDVNRPPATFCGKTLAEACKRADEAIRARDAARAQLGGF